MSMPALAFFYFLFVRASEGTRLPFPSRLIVKGHAIDQGSAMRTCELTDPFNRFALCEIAEGGGAKLGFFFFSGIDAPFLPRSLIPSFWFQ